MASQASSRPILSLLVDAESPPESVAAAVAAGVDWVQLRERRLGGAALLDLARRIAEAARGARLFVNRRIDLALAIEADGVHLGFDALSVGEARGLLGREAMIGVSTHAPAEVAEALAAGADYAQLAPIFDPSSKPVSRPALGWDSLSGAAECGLPVLAQGGIDAERAARAVEIGAAGVAVIGAILGAQDPAAAAAGLRSALDSAASSREARRGKRGGWEARGVRGARRGRET